MSVGYILVNHTKKEQIIFAHIPAYKKRELAGCSISASITTWYMLENIGDRISFVSDIYEDWPFESDSRPDLINYKEVTEETVTSLIKAEILQDEGIEIIDEDEPDLYFRKLRNIWQ